MYIDTHAHLNMPEYSDLHSVLDRAKDSKVETIINASYDIESSHASVALANNNQNIYAAVGIHPHDAQITSTATINEIRKLAANKKTLAIGETGLDYFRCLVPKEVQQNSFRVFLQLAQELSLPIIVHCREADQDVIRIMREENRGTLRAVFHCFAGDENLMRFALDMGFMVSFTGNITFKKAGLLRERARQIPINNLMIETDCPYMSPEPFRGERNEPSNVVFVAQAIANEKGLPVEEVAIATTQNARKFFNIPS